jgi:hypothetical protein
MDKRKPNKPDIHHRRAVGQCEKPVRSATPSVSIDNPWFSVGDTNPTDPAHSTDSTYTTVGKISMHKLVSEIKFSSTVFPDTDLGVHWQEKKEQWILWDRSYQIGRVRPAFGGGYWCEPYWGKADVPDSFETEEEAKAFLVAIYRLMQ